MEQRLNFSPQLRDTVSLPTSKSISNRVLVINYLAGGKAQLKDLSEADDTQVMKSALTYTQKAQGHALSAIDIHGAGTAMRFLTAAFSTGGIHILTGSERMKQRPIGILVDALRQLGAAIEYVHKQGYPPLRIQGRPLVGGQLEVAANISSQYISALLMIAPVLQQGLTLKLTGQMVSRPYIDMTLQMMELFGAKIERNNDAIFRVYPTGYQAPTMFKVEADWSAASYWYEMMALSEDQSACLYLPGLVKDSCQGDARVAQYFESLGVHTDYTDEGIRLTKQIRNTNFYDVDLTHHPDLAQTLAVTCAVLGQPFCLRGLNSLRIKETDRIAALCQELEKLGIKVQPTMKPTDEGEMAEALCGEGSVPDEKERRQRASAVKIATYIDHRMAMSFAPVAYRYKDLIIENAEVVEKSYPHFWQEIEKFKQH